jgi:hypothetical protein
VYDQNFNLDIFFSACLMTLDFWQAQLFKVMLPFIVLAVLLSVAFVMDKFRERQHPEIANRAFPNSMDKTISLYLKGVLGLTTYVVMVGFAPFRCFQHIDGTYSLVPSSSLSCYDAEWFEHLPIIVVGLMEIILLPASVLVIFGVYRNKHDSNKFRWRFGLLTISYNRSFYWWEVVALFRKLVFVMVVDLTNDFETPLRIFLAEVVLISGIFLETIFQPRRAETRVLHTL